MEKEAEEKLPRIPMQWGSSRWAGNCCKPVSCSEACCEPQKEPRSISSSTRVRFCAPCMSFIHLLPFLKCFPKCHHPNLHGDKEWDLIGEIFSVNIPSWQRNVLAILSRISLMGSWGTHKKRPHFSRKRTMLFNWKKISKWIFLDGGRICYLKGKRSLLHSSKRFRYHSGWKSCHLCQFWSK